MRKKRIKDLLECLDAWAPFSTQESYDNAGLVLGDEGMLVDKVLVCFDLTPEVVLEAVAGGAQAIISHHPPIFHGIKKIDPSTKFGTMLKLSIENNIAWIALHTNLDNAWNGVNSYLREALKLQDAEVLVSMPGASRPDTGAGVIGNLPAAVKPEALMDKLKKLTGAVCIRHSEIRHKVKRVALCGGSGSSFIGEARRKGADVYVTGDLKYHDFADAAFDMGLMDIGHYESEHFAVKLICAYIRKKFPTFAVLVSEQSENPVHYY